MHHFLSVAELFQNGLQSENLKTEHAGVVKFVRWHHDYKRVILSPQCGSLDKQVEFMMFD